MKRSLHLGINKYDERVYGSKSSLNGCVPDALNMDNLAYELGYEERTVLLDRSATLSRVREQIKDLAAKSVAGDTVLISYSCHGTQVRDFSGEEKDGKDEAICLHDTLLYDDEFVELLALFAEGVNVNVCADTCHSQDQIRMLEIPGSEAPDELPRAIKLDDTPRSSEAKGTPVMKASVIQYAACKSNEVAWDLGDGGAFTKALLEVARTKKKRSASFIDAIARKVKKQHPSLTLNNASRAHRMKTALV